MTSDAKIGFLLGLAFIVIIGFVINGLPDFLFRNDQGIASMRLNMLAGIENSYDVKNPNSGHTISWLSPEVMQKNLDYQASKAIQFLRTEARMQQAIEAELRLFDKRVRTIESKFPDETDFSKMTMLNNALLTTRIDHLTKQLDGIQAKLLTRWDVALVVAAIITGIVSILFTASAVVKASQRQKSRYRYSRY